MSQYPIATAKQLNYIEILFNECKLGDHKKKQDFLHLRFKVNFSDQLTMKQASEVITELKEIKDSLGVKKVSEE